MSIVFYSISWLMWKMTLLKEVIWWPFPHLTIENHWTYRNGRTVSPSRVFLKLRFDKNWESKEFEVSQFGKNQSEENLKVRILNRLYVKGKVCLSLSSFLVPRCSASCQFDQEISRISSCSVLQGTQGPELDYVQARRIA